MKGLVRGLGTRAEGSAAYTLRAEWSPSTPYDAPLAAAGVEACTRCEDRGDRRRFRVRVRVGPIGVVAGAGLSAGRPGLRASTVGGPHD